MILSNSFALWGLLFLLVPIAVHFFDFRRTKKVVFSNVAFLELVTLESTPKSRIKELLILLARCLSLLFLVLVFSGPVLLKDSNFSSASKLIILDNSFSLGDNCEGEPCLERAKRVLLAYSQEADNTRLFYSGLVQPKSFYDQQELVSLLQSVDFQKAHLKLTDIAIDDDQVVVFSDFQSSFIDRLKSGLTDSSNVLLLPIERSVGGNLWIDTVYLENRFSLGNQKKSLIVGVTNSGNRKFTNSLVRLINGGQQVSSVALDIEPEQSVRVALEFEASDDPTYEIGLEDNTFEVDNRFFLTIPPANKLNVCIVGAKPNRNIEVLFQNVEYFNFYIYNERSVDFEQVLNADLVVFHSFDQIPVWADLKRMKGNVIVIPAVNIDIENYSAFLSQRLNASADTILRELRLDNLKHPFFEGMFDKIDSRTTMPQARVLYRINGIQEELLGANLPFLQRMEQNGKSIFWFSGPLEDRYSTLQNHALFLPIMYRIAERSLGADRPLYTRLSDRPLTLSFQLGTNLPVLKGNGAEYVPEIYPNQSEVSLTLPDDLNASGHYYLISEADTLHVLALNIPREESLMNWHDADMLRDVFAKYPNVKVLSTQSINELQASLSEMKDGKPIWKYALLLALMFLVAEIAIHRWVK